jgi:general secretion pathway protein J
VSRTRGFTLIEVMIALTLLSMIMVATIAALRTFGNTKVTLEQMTNRVDEIRVVSGFLRNTIGAAMPVMRVGAIDDTLEDAAGFGTYFWGGPTHLVWVSRLVAGASLGGAFVMQVTYRDDKLEIQWHPYVRSVEALHGDDVQSRVLLDDVEEFELGYLPAFGDEWVDEWAGIGANPVAVRMNIKSRGKYWPELVMRLDLGESNTQ